ncbi:MAG: flippase-like domain-containing protein [Clostridia bacterium]|nr:flippase-like domain-containing protein [Clostridia bacterium]
MKSRKIELFICISCGVAVVGFILFSNDPKTLVRSLHELNPFWLLGSILCMVGYWFFETLTLHFILKRFYGDEPFSDSINVTMGGQYFSAITPFSTGGQPFQTYYLAKKGRSVGVTASALLTKFLIYQLSLVILSTILLVIKWDFFKTTVPNFYWLVIIGYIVNLTVLVVMTVIGVFRGIADWICKTTVKLGAKLRIVKNKEETLEKAEEGLALFHSTFRGLFKHVPVLLAGMVFSTMQLLCYFSVSYFIYRSFGLSAVGLITIIAAQGFVLMVSSFVPIPGSGVGAEASFSLFFASFFTKEGQLGVAVILWRLISFYLTIVVGVFFAMNIRKAKKSSKNAAAEAGAEAINEEEAEILAEIEAETTELEAEVMAEIEAEERLTAAETAKSTEGTDNIENRIVQ